MTPVLPTEPSRLDEQTHAFLVAHLDIWALFCRLTFELIAAGREHYGAKSVIERMRWHADTSAHHALDLDFVLNNSNTASLSRIFAATFPAHSQFFRTRTRPSERKAA